MRAKALAFKRAKRLRREMSLPEVALWDHLRKGKLGALRFRRQHPVGSYILDFYRPSARLAVEIDGEVTAIRTRRATTARGTAGWKLEV